MCVCVKYGEVRFQFELMTWILCTIRMHPCPREIPLPILTATTGTPKVFHTQTHEQMVSRHGMRINWQRSIAMEWTYSPIICRKLLIFSRFRRKPNDPG